MRLKKGRNAGVSNEEQPPLRGQLRKKPLAENKKKEKRKRENGRNHQLREKNNRNTLGIMGDGVLGRKRRGGEHEEGRRRLTLVFSRLGRQKAASGLESAGPVVFVSRSSSVAGFTEGGTPSSQFSRLRYVPQWLDSSSSMIPARNASAY